MTSMPRQPITTVNTYEDGPDWMLRFEMTFPDEGFIRDWETVRLCPAEESHFLDSEDMELAETKLEKILLHRREERLKK